MPKNDLTCPKPISKSCQGQSPDCITVLETSRQGSNTAVQSEEITLVKAKESCVFERVRILV